jgi:hypothetical protein
MDMKTVHPRAASTVIHGVEYREPRGRGFSSPGGDVTVHVVFLRCNFEFNMLMCRMYTFEMSLPPYGMCALGITVGQCGVVVSE